MLFPKKEVAQFIGHISLSEFLWRKLIKSCSKIYVPWKVAIDFLEKNVDAFQLAFW